MNLELYMTGLAGLHLRHKQHNIKTSNNLINVCKLREFQVNAILYNSLNACQLHLINNLSN